MTGTASPSARLGDSNGSMRRLIITGPYARTAINPTTRSTATLLPLVTEFVARCCNATDLSQLPAASVASEFRPKTLR